MTVGGIFSLIPINSCDNLMPQYSTMVTPLLEVK